MLWSKSRIYVLSPGVLHTIFTPPATNNGVLPTNIFTGVIKAKTINFVKKFCLLRYLMQIEHDVVWFNDCHENIA